MPALLTVENIRVQRKGRALLDGVSLEAGPGFTAIVGPNGAGKSTLIRVLSGEIRAQAGRVLFEGVELHAWERHTLARRRGVLPQESVLNFPFTVREVVELGRLPHNDCPAEVINAALASADIAHLADRHYTNLSGGEKQRVQCARVLAQTANGDAAPAPLLLLDEPTAALDPAHQFAILDIAAQKARSGAIVCAVLHDLDLAARYADTVAVLDRGRLATHAPVAEALTPAVIEPVFGVKACTEISPATGRPRIHLEPGAPETNT